MAGESVEMTDIALTKRDYLKKAMDYCYDVINSGKFRLNPDYSQVFINYITDTYDVEYYESMWEVDFLGDRSNANEWTNGRIGDLIGLQSNGSSDYKEFNCNYSYGQYDGSPKLWYLYTRDDRTDEEYGNILKNDAGETVTDEDGNTVYCFDARQEWNLPPDEVYRRMKRVNLIEGYILKHYEAIHAESRENITEDIAGCLLQWEKAEKQEEPV